MPSPVMLDTGNTGLPASSLPASKLFDLRLHLGHSRCRSTRSILVSATAPCCDPEQVDNLQMLAGLRHHAVVRRDHQQHDVDAGGAGQHVVHEALVARHVDETEHLAIRQRRIGVTEVDGDAARLLFLEAIGIHAGERLDERRLAVIDVASGADDHGYRIPPRR